MNNAVRTPEIAPQFLMRAIATQLGSYQYRFGSEVQLHERLGAVLDAGGHQFVREHRLDAHNRADFWLAGVVIEVKVDGSGGAAMRQALRYAELPQVTGVIVASTCRWADTAFPSSLAGKPFAVVRLWRQAL